MTVQDLMTKARRAATPAQVLLDAGDADGAANRAYYAMFDAARAAPLAKGSDAGRTHKGVLIAFSERLVRTGEISKDMGRSLKHAEAFRYVADYEGAPVELSDARALVEQAQAFVSALQAIVAA